MFGFGKKEKKKEPKIEKVCRAYPLIKGRPISRELMYKQHEWISFIKYDGNEYVKVDPDRHYTLLRREYDWDKELRELRRKKGEMEKVIKEFEEKLKARERDFEALKCENEELQDKNKRLKDENEVLQRDLIFRKTNANEHTVEELLRYEIENTKLRKENNQLKKARNIVENKVTTDLRCENNKLRDELTTIKKKCKENAELARKRAELFINSKDLLYGKVFKNYCPACGARGSLKKDGIYIKCNKCDSLFTDEGNGCGTWHRLEVKL